MYNWSSVGVTVRENTKGTVLPQRMDWTSHLFANAMQLVAASIRTITGMIKRRICRRRNLTDSSSSAKSLVSWYYGSDDYN